MDNFKFKASKKETPLIFRYIICLLTWVLLSLALLLIFTFVAYKGKDPTSYVKIFPYIALFLSVIMTGAITPRVTGGGVLSSLIIGASASLILFFTSLIFEKNLTLYAKLILLGATVLTAWLSAVIFKKRSKKSLAAKYKKFR